jgi:glycosyltransferase involved in cell wall biosynthesis
MSSRPRVSIVLIFLDEERFLDAAVESVRAQSFEDWELLLVDDGSSDGSPEIARRHAGADPDRIRYLEHPGHANLGPSAARNAGIAASRSELIAFLDGDDVWLPQRLARSVALLDAHPEADMAYGRTEYWWSWAGLDAGERDWAQPHGFRADRTIAPPELLRMFLAGEAAIPCIGSLTLRRDAVLDSGGFVDEFRGLYEDQVFLARVCVGHAVYVSSELWDRYRQHPASACAIAARSDAADRARAAYLDWLADFLASRGHQGTPLWDAALRAGEPRARRWPARMARSLRQAARRILGDGGNANRRSGREP